MKKVNVLSCFNGMSCGKIALDLIGIEVDKYYSCEIDKYAMKASAAMFPNIIELGDITKVSAYDLEKIDIIIGGSPCQGFSFAGKQLNFKDPRSKLFFEFVRLLNECRKINPDVKFLLENVKMKKEYEVAISKMLNIAPIKINSALVSAQNRERLYWTNIANQPYGFFGDMECVIPQPKNKGIMLKDILETEVDKKYYLSKKMLHYFSNKAANFNQGKVNVRDENGKASTILSSSFSCDISDNFISCVDFNGRENNEKTGTITSSYAKGVENFGSRPFIKMNTNLEISENQEKSNCFTAGGNSGGLHSQMDLICVAQRGRNPEEPSNRKKGIHLEQTLEPRIDGKTNCITSVQKDNLIVNNTMPRSSTGKGGSGPLSRNDGKTYCLDTQIRNAVEIVSGTLRTYHDGRGLREIKTGKGATIPARAREDGSGQNVVSIDSIIRRLTPRECGRLQTVPEHLLDIMLSCGISDTQLYKMFGNGWTVYVIVYILSFYKAELQGIDYKKSMAS